MTAACEVCLKDCPEWPLCVPCRTRLTEQVQEVVERYLELSPFKKVRGLQDGRSGGSPTFESKSPADDVQIAMTDWRSKAETHGDLLSPLGVFHDWAKWVRRQLLITPAAVVTIVGEADVLLTHLDHIAGDQGQAFADDLFHLLRQLRGLDPREKSVAVGTCPRKRPVGFSPDGTQYEECGTVLRVQLGATEIRCPQCKARWGQEMWHELGDPWTDYTQLHEWLGVSVAQLRKWAHRDGWQNKRVGKRALVNRHDAMASYVKRGLQRDANHAA